MSGNTEADVIAGEFTLGLLDDAEAATVAASAARDPVLAGDVFAWNDRLAGLATTVAAVETSADLWFRIAGTVAPAPTTAATPAARAPIVQAPARPRRRRSGLAPVLVSLAVVAIVAGVLLLFGDRLFGTSRPGVGPTAGAARKLPAGAPPATPVAATAVPMAVSAAPDTIELAALASPDPLPPPVGAEARLDPVRKGPADAARAEMTATVLGSFLLKVVVVRPIRERRGTELGVWVTPKADRDAVLVGRMGPGGGTFDLPVAVEPGAVATITAEPADRPSRARPGPTLLQGRFGGG